MAEVSVLLNTVEKVKNFESVVRNASADMDLGRGRYTVDAKSIMGIFSLDLSTPLTLKIYDEETPFDTSLIKDFIVQ